MPHYGKAAFGQKQTCVEVSLLHDSLLKAFIRFKSKLTFAHSQSEKVNNYK